MTNWWTILGPSIGLIVGWLLNYLGTKNLEQRRWRQQRQDKLDEARRPALERALAWLDPMDEALNTAETEMYMLLNGDQDDQQFRARYPNLLSELRRLDLSPEQRLLLTTDPYPMGNRIRAAIEHLKHEAVDLWGKTRYPIHSPSMSVVDARLEGTARVLALRKEVDALRQALSDDHRKTYVP